MRVWHTLPNAAARRVIRTQPARWHVLERLIKKHGWRRGAELGVYRGDTYLYLLEHCPKLTLIAVDVWRSPARAPFEDGVRLRAAKYGERSLILKMTTVEAANHISDESLDFVFIDADHSRRAVVADVFAWAPKVKPSGWITGHDYQPKHADVMHVVNEVFPSARKYSDSVWACPRAQSVFAAC